MRKITDLAASLHKATGAEGKELEVQTFMVAMLFADVMGNQAIGDYFQRRMRDAFAATN